MDSLRARRVLDDGKEAFERLSRAKEETDRRLLWVLTVALLRAIGHVLHKVDASSNTKLKPIVGRYWKEWQNSNNDDSRIFREFIDNERNNILKQYEFRPDFTRELIYLDVGGGALLAVDDKGTLLSVGEKDMFSEPIYDNYDPLGAADTVLRWWERQLALIETEYLRESAGDR